MKRVLVVVSSLIVVASLPAAAQQTQPKLTPDELKAAQATEKRMQESIAYGNAHPGPSYSELQCRADAQSWTTDGSDKASLIVGATGIMVNGQARWIPNGGTPHLPMTSLMERIHEMAACQTSDASFQKQFETYSRLERNYEDEREFRYMSFILNHNLMDQFMKEDAAANK